MHKHPAISKLIRSTFTLVVTVALLSKAGFPGPQFSREYNTSCSTCHTVYPKLNDIGKAFLDAGFQFPAKDAAAIANPAIYLTPSNVLGNLAKYHYPSSGLSPSQTSTPTPQALQQDLLDKIKALASKVESSRFPYRFCLTQDLRSSPELKCGSQYSISVGELENKTTLEISGTYYAAYSRSQMDQNARIGTTFRDTILPILKMAVAKFANVPEIQSYAVEVSHHVRSRILGVPYEGQENVALVLSSNAAQELAQSTDLREQQEILQGGKVYVDAKPTTLRLSPAPEIR